MSNLFFNKVAASVLATGLGFMLIGEISHSLMHAKKPETPAYALALPEAGGSAEADIELPFPQPEWIAAMDAERGAKVFKKCASCHNAEKGGANGTGPNLWGIVEHPAAKHAGFNYSSALSNSGIVWTYEALDGFLAKPSAYVSGTAMSFVGLKKEADRAAVIAYLRQSADSLAPLPEPAATPETAEAEMQDDAMSESVDQMVGDVVNTAQEITEDTVNAAQEAAEATSEAAQEVEQATNDQLDEMQEKAEEKTPETAEH